MILFLGDVHGCFGHVLPMVQKLKPAAIIFLGDLDLARPFEIEVAEVMKLTEVYFIHGNHDTDCQENYDFLMSSELADRNFHRRVVEIDGLKVAGLGGIFREKIWYPKFDAESQSHCDSYDDYIDREAKTLKRQEAFRSKNKTLYNDPYENQKQLLVGKRLTHKSTIFYDDWLSLYSQEADILLTHEAPCCHPHGFVGLSELARGMKVKKTFHGHHHDCLDYSSHTQRLGFEAHGVGFCGVSDESGKKILDGDFDHQSQRRRDFVGNFS